jgi:mannitol/fructose-specific phosphotransferase system IIA component
MTTPSTADPGQALLTRDLVQLGVAVADRDEAIAVTGRMLVDAGAVRPPYVEAMAEREAIMSSYMGEGFALPHGTDASRTHVERAAIAFVRFAAPVEWEDGEEALVAVAVAAASDEHIGVLASLARVLSDPDAAERLRTTDDVDEVLALLAPADDEEAA